MAEAETEEDEQNFDVPQSKEEKPEAYPHGPITVYESGIDLYLEPTAEQASKYDVILNVASEVKNPFLAQNEPASEPERQIRLDGGGGIQYAPRRDHPPVRRGTDDTAKDSSPTTPKATLQTDAFSPEATATSTSKPDPEYIHIPWEHNTDIVPDLLRFVKLIDDRVSEGKKVLVHCQCGVSRSASLVVAYGLYKNPSMSVQEAYDAVKMRSKWIGPNMSLIMQLQEFRSSLARGGVILGDSRTPITPSTGFNEWHRPVGQIDGSLLGTPRTAPIVSDNASVQTSSSEPVVVVSPGPSSAPSGLPWPVDGRSASTNGEQAETVRQETAYVDPSGHIVPVVKVVKVVQADATHVLPYPQVRTRPPALNLEEICRQKPSNRTVVSPRSDEFAMTPLQPSPDVDAADSFGIMSPSTTEFSASPFDRAALLSSLGMGSAFREHEPDRETQLRAPSHLQHDQTTNGDSTLKLRKKLSSPSIQQRQELQSLQAKIEASLPNHGPSDSGVDFDALMSPRASEFTQNPFALALETNGTFKVDEEPTTPRSPDEDPRSPAQKGASPITRNILDYL